MITNLQGMRACPHSFLKTKRNTQPSFKSNVITKKQNQSMTQEQKTWLGVGLTTLAAIAIGICKHYKYKPANYFMFKHCIDKWQNGQHVWYKYGICA